VDRQGLITFVVPEGSRVKKGDLLVELASDEIEAEIEEDTLQVESARSELIAAENALEIQKNENDAALRQARLKLELAQIELKKWQEGDLVKRRQELDLNIEKADRNLELFDEQYRQTKDLFDRGFESKDRLKEDEIRTMFGGQTGVPMILRTQGGTGRSAGAQHSQSLEAWVMHTPGLRLAMPATAADAYHLLRHALTLPDPVVFIEHKALYARKESADLSAPVAPWGHAAVRRSGADLVIVTYSRQVHHAVEAAEALAAEGIFAGVVDLRTLNPLDMETVRREVERTGRAMVVSEGPLTAGVAAELAARITEECFDFLEEPAVRVAGEDVPIAVAPALEAASVPSSGLIAEVARRMVRRRAA